MSYMQDLEAKLTNMLNSSADTGTLVRLISEVVLQSYKNGIKAGKEGKDVIRQGKSRRSGFRPPEAPRRESRY